jgi:hypothetical protein
MESPPTDFAASFGYEIWGENVSEGKGLKHVKNRFSNLALGNNFIGSIL